MSLHFEGSSMFRARIACSLLSGRRIKITGIREGDESPGLQDFEANYLRLIEKICNGCKIEINETGTTLIFTPGFISGGKVEHTCANSRSVGWYLEGILGVAPFGKIPLLLTLKGVTNDDLDFSFDTLKEVTLPLLKRFGLTEGMSIKVNKRGAPPLGGGEIYFVCPTMRSVNSINFTKPGFVKRIRGTAYATRVSPQTANRMVEHARSLLNNFIPDVYIYTDHYKGAESGASPGYGLSLVASTTEGVLYSAEGAASSGSLPEDLGLAVAQMLCEEISRGGCVDTSHQSLALLFMTLSSEDVSKISFGKLSDYTIAYLRLLKEFFGVIFKITPDDDSDNVLLSCVGTGFTNVSRKIA